MRWILFVILAVILVIILRRIAALRRGAGGGARFSDGGRRPDGSVSVTAARAGDTIEIDGVGERYERVRFTVDRRNRYESGGETWYELSGKHRGDRVYVELYEDDELEVTVQLKEANLSLEELGLSEDDLIRMDEERSPENTVSYGGETWRYEASEEIGYSKDGRAPLEGYYNWDFQSEDRQRILFVEKWEGEPFAGGVSFRVHPDDVRVSRE